jgi:hypothetical protein
MAINLTVPASFLKCSTPRGLEGKCGQPMHQLCQFCGPLCVKDWAETNCTNGREHSVFGE